MKYAILFFLLGSLVHCASPDKKEANNVSSDSSSSGAEEGQSAHLASDLNLDEEKAFSELTAYDGTYALYTESEGAEGTLEVKYKGDKIFTFKLHLKALDLCEGNVEGEIFMDRTQHGFFSSENCLLHINFLGNSENNQFAIEIDQPDKCDRMEGECIFSGKYIARVQ